MKFRKQRALLFNLVFCFLIPASEIENCSNHISYLNETPHTYILNETNIFKLENLESRIEINSARNLNRITPTVVDIRHL